MMEQSQFSKVIEWRQSDETEALDPMFGNDVEYVGFSFWPDPPHLELEIASWPCLLWPSDWDGPAPDVRCSAYLDAEQCRDIANAITQSMNWLSTDAEGNTIDVMAEDMAIRVSATRDDGVALVHLDLGGGPGGGSLDWELHLTWEMAAKMSRDFRSCGRALEEVAAGVADASVTRPRPKSPEFEKFMEHFYGPTSPAGFSEAGPVDNGQTRSWRQWLTNARIFVSYYVIQPGWAYLIGMLRRVTPSCRSASPRMAPSAHTSLSTVINPVGQQ